MFDDRTPDDSNETRVKTVIKMIAYLLVPHILAGKRVTKIKNKVRDQGEFFFFFKNGLKIQKKKNDGKTLPKIK